MQKITVEISAKGYIGLTAENIEKALCHYFGSPTLGVSFSVTEVAQPPQAEGECACNVLSLMGGVMLGYQKDCPIPGHADGANC